MSLTIDDPPTVTACFPCGRPLRWLYSPRTDRWVAFATEPGDVRLLRVHECPRYPGDRPPPTWREVHEIDEDTKRVGIARVRQALASKENET